MPTRSIWSARQRAVLFDLPTDEAALLRHSKRLHVFEPRRVPKPLVGLTGNKIREDVIVRNWPDILRVAATLASGVLPPSQLLRTFAAYPRQHELAVALREIGRVERTLFIVDWLLDADMQRRAKTGLNRGEAHHALKNALRIGRQGEVRDRASEGQHYRMAGLNLVAAIVIYWNTAHLGEAAGHRQHAGLTVEPEPWPTSHSLGGPISCSPANTSGQNVESGLSVRFCPLPESTRSCRDRPRSVSVTPAVCGDSRPTPLWASTIAATASRIVDMLFPSSASSAAYAANTSGWAGRYE